MNSRVAARICSVPAASHRIPTASLSRAASIIVAQSSAPSALRVPLAAASPSISHLPIISTSHFSIFQRSIMTEAETGGPVQQSIRQKLINELEPLHLEIENESYKHAVPKGSESHFKVVVVSAKFEGLQLLKQHQLVNSILKDELAKSVHALAIKTATPDKWKSNGGVLNLETPNCMGGSKNDPQMKRKLGGS